MSELTTKQKIAKEALDLFSKQGYGSVSIRDISKAVGIKESSLYNHFKNKQDIFDSIVEECTKIADCFFDSMNLYPNVADEDNDFINRYKTMSDEEFLSISIGIFQFYFQEENLVKFRKMLTIEQYNNVSIRALYRKVFINSTLDFQSTLFKLLMEQRVFIKVDPYVLALQFYAPIFLMFYQYDELTDNATDILIRHIIQFKETYTIKLRDEDFIYGQNENK